MSGSECSEYKVSVFIRGIAPVVFRFGQAAVEVIVVILDCEDAARRAVGVEQNDGFHDVLIPFV